LRRSPDKNADVLKDISSSTAHLLPSWKANHDPLALFFLIHEPDAGTLVDAIPGRFRPQETKRPTLQADASFFRSHRPASKREEPAWFVRLCPTLRRHADAAVSFTRPIQMGRSAR
jgi:hypothetical protein